MPYQLGNIKHLRFWANKVLPLVYDESLSYYECICKIMNAINRLIEVEDMQNNAIDDLDNRATSLEGRMDTAESDIDTLEDRATELEDRATSLEGRMDTAENDIDTLEDRMDTAEGDIDNLETRATALENRATSLEGRMDTAEGEIDTLQNNVEQLGNGLNTLGTNVTRNRTDIDNIIPRMANAETDIDNIELITEYLESDKEDKGDSLIDYIAVRGGATMQLYNGYYLHSDTQILFQEWAKAYSTYGELVGNSTMLRVNNGSSTFFTPLWNVRKNKDGTNKAIKIYHDTNTSGSTNFEPGLGNLGNIKVIYYGRDSQGYNMSDADYFTETITNATEFTPPLTITHTPSGTVYDVIAFRLLLPRAWANASGGGLITYDNTDYTALGVYPRNTVVNGGNEESVRGAIYSTALLAMENAGRLTTAEENITQNNLDSIARDRDMQSDISTLQGQIGNFSVVTLTQAQYNAIANPAANTIYLIVG